MKTKKHIQVSIVCYFYVRKKRDIRNYICLWLFVQKYGKDKLETNEIGYLKGESGIGVKRL